MVSFMKYLVASFVVAQADEHAGSPTPGLASSSGINPFDYMYPVNVPSTDKCGVNCIRLCGEGLGRKSGSAASECKKTCYAHSIETTRARTLYSAQRQQGKYMQKVMTEYCERGVCKAGRSLLEAVAIKKHEQQEGAAWGYPAKASGWPKTCETQTYYCQEVCQNLYHKPTGDLGVHPGSDSNWKSNQNTCKTDCGKNFAGLSGLWNEFCTCTKQKGGVRLPEGLLQQSPEEDADEAAERTGEKPMEVGEEPMDMETEDVGAFIQMPAEL